MTLSMSYKQASKWGLFVLLVGLFFSAVLAWQVSRINAQTISQALEERAQQISENVTNRITLYQYGLRGARGMILTAGEDHISRSMFQNYSLTRDVDEEFPGARGFGFIRRVPKENEAQFLARVKSMDWPDFHIRQLNPNEGEKYLIDRKSVV